jgi:hypothetical protein
MAELSKAMLGLRMLNYILILSARDFEFEMRPKVCLVLALFSDDVTVIS